MPALTSIQSGRCNQSTEGHNWIHSATVIVIIIIITIIIIIIIIVIVVENSRRSFDPLD